MLKKLNYRIYLIILPFILITIGATIGTTYARFTISHEYSGSIDIPETNYCLNNGFQTLSDCMLVMENYSKSTEEAKSYITSKGNPTVNKIAPTITFIETTTDVNNANGVISTTAHFTLGKSYTFNSSTGLFSLTEYSNTELTDDYINYYTCGSTTSTWASCGTIYQIKAYTKIEAGDSITYKVTSAVRYNYKAADSFDSEVGLYTASDEDGTTYFYRGNVKNNYVSYAGFIWRIVRRNGDGSIRLIYSGTSTSATGANTQIGTSQYNSKYYDPTYVGYKYTERFELNESNTTNTTYTNMTDSAIYYYASSYQFDSTTGKFSLSGEKISGTWKSSYSEVISKYPYSCLSTSANGTCNFLVKLLKYVNNSSATINYISYSSKDYSSILLNETDSSIKVKVDTWYETNIKNKTDSNGELYSNYLVDKVFCNDRSLTSGSGYLLTPTTTYGAYTRNASKREPSLSCTQESDKFSVANGNLKYPVALLTIDEAALAGGVLSNVNTQYYLYTGATYWTMSPYIFNASYASAYVWYVNSTGILNAYWAALTYGVRPVINLSADVLITDGDGTADHPYEVTMSNS